MRQDKFRMSIQWHSSNLVLTRSSGRFIRFFQLLCDRDSSGLSQPLCPFLWRWHLGQGVTEVTQLLPVCVFIGQGVDSNSQRFSNYQERSKIRALWRSTSCMNGPGVIYQRPSSSA